MSVDFLASLAACVACTASGAVVLARGESSRVGRLAGLLILGGALSAGCLLIAATAIRPQTVRALLELSTLGWVALGPLSLHLLVEVVAEPSPRVHRFLPRAYGAAFLFLVLDWTTPWVHAGVVPTRWGWGYALGPAYPLWWVLTAGLFATTVVLGFRAFRRLRSRTERRQAVAVGAIAGLSICASMTVDGVLPFFGIQTPRLGGLAHAALGTCLAWALTRTSFSRATRSATEREIVARLRDGVMVVRADGRVSLANPAMSRLAGCTERALLGMPVRDLLGVEPSMRASSGETGGSLRPLLGDAFPIVWSVHPLPERSGGPDGATIFVHRPRPVAKPEPRSANIDAALSGVRASLMLLRDSWMSFAGASGASTDTGTGKTEEELETLFAAAEEQIDESLAGVARTASLLSGDRDLAVADESPLETAQPQA